MRTVKGYKLFRLRKDGSIGPLFINQKQRIEPGVWYDAEDHPTKGYQHRPGWHATTAPVAPHLCERGRVWCEVRMTGIRRYNRPQSQGGTWVLAKRLKVVKVFKDGLPPVLRVVADRAALEICQHRGIVQLGIENDGLVYASWRTFGVNRHYTPCNDLETLGNLLQNIKDVWGTDPENLYLGSSSSLDFPEEYTDNPQTLKFCKQLRG